MQQYALDMPLPVHYSLEQFVVSQSNRLAYDAVMRWPDWPSSLLYLYGDADSGKTHLAHIWSLRSGAVFLPVDGFCLPETPVIIENIERWSDGEGLFHLYNHCHARGIGVLVTSRDAPSRLPFALPDLLSRLKSSPQLRITAPDDALLAALLRKQLADRQLKLAPEVLDYLLPRLPRSCGALSEIVARIDQDSLASGRPLTIPYIRQICGW